MNAKVNSMLEAIRQELVEGELSPEVKDALLKAADLLKKAVVAEYGKEALKNPTYKWADNMLRQKPGKDGRVVTQLRFITGETMNQLPLALKDLPNGGGKQGHDKAVKLVRAALKGIPREKHNPALDNQER